MGKYEKKSISKNEGIIITVIVVIMNGNDDI